MMNLARLQWNPLMTRKVHHQDCTVAMCVGDDNSVSSAETVPGLDPDSDSDSDDSSQSSIETLGSLPELDDEYYELPKTVVSLRKDYDKRRPRFADPSGKLNKDIDNNEDRLMAFHVKELCWWLGDSFACKKCRKQFHHQDLDFFLRGFVGETVFCCSNCNDKQRRVCRAETVASEPTKPEVKMSNHFMLPNNKYLTNLKLVMTCQRLGVSSQGADKFMGRLGFNHFGLSNFTDIEEEIALAEIGLSKETLLENLEIEKSLSPFDAELEKWKITGSLDAGWNKRSTGKIYNSKSG